MTEPIFFVRSDRKLICYLINLSSLGEKLPDWRYSDHRAPPGAASIPPPSSDTLKRSRAAEYGGLLFRSFVYLFAKLNSV